jgi:epoxyqueuosine reductase
MESFDQTNYAGIISDAGSTYEYQYRTMSVKHFSELQEDIERLRRGGQLSNSKVFQGYLSDMKFALPEDFPNAKSVIVMAVFVKPMTVHFQFGGTRVPAAMPPNYYESGLTRDTLLDEVRKNIIKQDEYRVERMSDTFYLKLLAVRSGLGQYGRNNICYVDGMGSFLTLHAFLTDYPFEDDHWGEMQMMELCQNCRICIKQCPGGAIREDNFLVDINHCITLYNEVEGEFPDWIPSDVHHAYMGCMKCQSPCPANREPMKRTGQLEDITEEETRQFISGNPEEGIILSVSQKLKIPYLVKYKETVEVASRNIKALLHV